MVDRRNLLKTVATLVGAAGPVVVKYLKDHPEITESVSAAVTKLLTRSTRGPAGMIETVAVLREQVVYLREHADDEAEARRAQAWSRRLDNLDHAAAMLSSSGSRKEAKLVRRQLTTLRGEILAAFIAEKADGAGRGQITS